MSTPQQLTKSDLIQSIRNNYEELEQSIVSQLLLETPNHSTTTGTYREQIWMSLFRQIIPHKFSIAQSVFIIDSNKETDISKEVDFAVFDEQSTPYIFNYGNIKFIPIEAVAMVVQCKSKNVNNEKKNLKGWVNSIDKLKTCNKSIARFATSIQTESPKTQKATRPIKVLCALDKCLDNNQKPLYGFDIGIYAYKKEDKDSGKNKSKGKLVTGFSSDFSDLYKAYRYLNFKGEPDEGGKNNLSDKKIELLKVSNDSKKNEILSLIFQLNQLLMLINNPMLFPHQAYVKMFNDKEN